MKNKISTFVLGALLSAGQVFSYNSNLEIDALDGTYEYKGARVTEVDDGFLVSVDAFKEAPGVYYVKFSKEQCSLYRSGDRFESINCSMDSYPSNQLPVFLLPRGPGDIKRVTSALIVSFSLDRTFVRLLISNQEIRFGIQQILTYKMLDRTQLSFPLYVL